MSRHSVLVAVSEASVIVAGFRDPGDPENDGATLDWLDATNEAKTWQEIEEMLAWRDGALHQMADLIGRELEQVQALKEFARRMRIQVEEHS